MALRAKTKANQREGLNDALAQLEAWGLLRGSCQGRWP
jgi:hypothetical protein